MDNLYSYTKVELVKMIKELEGVAGAERIICGLTNSELYQVREALEREINFSEIAIQEGHELKK